MTDHRGRCRSFGLRAVAPRWVVAALLCLAVDARAAGTLVVKYTEAVNGCAETTFARHRPFARVSPDASLDALHADLGVTEIRSLFMRRAGLDARQATGQWRARMERALHRNPRRAERAGGTLAARIPDVSRIYRVRYAADVSPEEAARRYAANPWVEYAHPDYPVELEHIPNDPYFSTAGSWNNPYLWTFDDLWNMKIIGAPAAWDVTMGDGTVIAIVDTGVDRTHPDIAANIWSNPGEIPNNGIDDDGNGFIDDTWGWDFLGGDNDPRDTHGHGTHVAGIAAATGDNGIGVIGVAPHARVMSVRLLDGADNGRSGDAAAAILYAAENGADVISNSWGSRGVPNSGALEDAIETANALGAVVVFAGSNGGLVLSAVPWWQSAHAINVGMSNPHEGVFSGSDVDIAAPGWEVLSLKSGHGIDGPVVGGDYVVADGTSMATPHVAGAAALLLSVFPALTPAEVKWRLETAAVQPGIRGWEGIPWNPWAGWGRLDLTHLFEPTPITTRLDRYARLDRYEFADRVSAPVHIGHAFTTYDPVAWNAEVPGWIQAAPAAGAGDGGVDLSMDGTAVGAGVYDGLYRLSVPGAADGGASLPVRLNVLPDVGLGPTSLLFSQAREGLDLDYGIIGLASAAGPTRTLVAWHRLLDPQTRVVALDPVGNVVGSVPLAIGTVGQYVDIAFDGREFAVLWIQYEGGHRHLLLSRFAADGTAVGSPRQLWSSTRFWIEPRIAFDGSEYVITWTDVATMSRIFMLRMGADFAVDAKPRVLYRGAVGGSSRDSGRADLACGVGHCLAVWRDRDPLNQLNDPIRAQRFVNGEPVGAPFDLTVNKGTFEPIVVASGGDYLVLVGTHWVSPCGPTRNWGCDKAILGMRVGADGTVRDPAPVEMITAPADAPMGVELGQAGFDGVAWVVPYTLSNDCAGNRCDSAVLAARISLAGELLDAGNPGHSLLVDASRERVDNWPTVASTADGLTVAWAGYARDPVTQIGDDVRIEARALDRQWADALTTHELGTIGPVALAEGEDWTVRLLASGLAPNTRRFSADSLPDGALLDASSGVLHWKPAANQAGSYPVRLVADDGGRQTEETLAITVSNATSSISGAVRGIDGAPVADVGIQISGRKLKRNGMSGPDGSFTFFDLRAGKFKLRLAPGSKKHWRAGARVASLASATDDVGGIDLVVTPR